MSRVPARWARTVLTATAARCSATISSTTTASTSTPLAVPPSRGCPAEILHTQPAERLANSPYMHPGRFATLEEVVEHYNSGIHRSPTLAPNLAKHSPEESPARHLGQARAGRLFENTISMRTAALILLALATSARAGHKVLAHHRRRLRRGQ